MINIKWPRKGVITPKIENELSDVLVTKGYYGEISPKQEKEIRKKLQSLKKRNINISYLQARAIRRVLLRDKLIKKHGKITRLHRVILTQYSDEKKDILYLSNKYDYPPVSMFRAILAARNVSKNKIKKMVTNPSSYLGKRDMEQLQKAINNDIISDPDNTLQAAAAIEFEDYLEDYFRKHKVNLKTQTDLAKEQKELIGRAVSTPDLYFPDGIKINGVIVYWVDAKNFYGGNVSYIRSGIKKQSEKYNRTYGPGAFVFHRGFSSALDVPAMILSI